MAENYDLIFGQGASSQYAWSDSDYQNGWKTVGSTPPTAEQFDALQRRSDTKAKELNDRLTPIETNNTHDYRQPSTAYVVGNIAYHASLPTGYYLECTTGGTTSRGDLTISSPRIGGTVSDGTVKWQIRKGVTLPYELPSYMETLLDDKDAKTARATLGAPSTTGANASGSWNINAATATKLASPRKINITGNATGAATFDGSGDVSINTTVNESKHAAAADSATKIVNNGNRDDLADGAKPPSGLSVYQCYQNTGYPQQFGNVLSIGGLGDNELFLGWQDDSRLLYRSKRDTQNNWRGWRAIAFTDEINNYAPTKTGDGASGTWGINISGNAASATKATSATTAAACSGNSATATKLATPRTISLTGNASGSANFDGSGDVSISTTVNESKHAAAADTLKSSEATETSPGARPIWMSSLDGDNTKQTVSPNLTYTCSTKTLAAANFKGHLAGNADSATKATNDGNGANIASTYVKKAGDTTTGKITFESTDLDNLPEVKKTSDDNMSGIRFSSKTKFLGAVGKRLSSGEDLLNLRSDNTTTDVVLDSRNYNNYAPTKTGGGASGTWGINISGNAATATKAGTCTGNSATATKLATARSIALTGNATGSATFDGSGNISISTNVNTATNADKLDGYHASDLLDRITNITPKTAAAIGQFRELVVNNSHQVKLPDGGTWAYFCYTYNSWSGGDSNGEQRTRTGAGIAAGGTVIHTDGDITSNTINAFKLSGTTDAGGADDNAIIVGGFCWRIA